MTNPIDHLREIQAERRLQQERDLKCVAALLELHKHKGVPAVMASFFRNAMWSANMWSCTSHQQLTTNNHPAAIQYPRTIRMRYLILLATALSSFTCALRAQLAQPPAGVTEGLLKELTNACPANPELGDLNASPVWSGWGGAGNARFQTKAAAGLAA